ncbi:peripheral-type benzodiazepine receptor-associated protein 1 isoform X13 [Dermochelys coriacea]|uniref:peripheral-type benzodiazepine receptor-associated protein 1 isoform X13 n=1 Tax=Dermochelys coriacea TaxID=27794 RepID=UPI001CA82499|nr:peripheral-type benzodiazepine receptor-associated protein 1 isoform X13 [Dermochelys coriacea]
MEKQEEMKPHADLIQLSPCQGCPAWHSSIVPEGLVCQDSTLVTDMQKGGAPFGDTGNGVVLELTPGVPQPGLEEVRNQSVLVQSQESSLWAPGQREVPMQALESIRPQCAMEGLRHYQTDGSSKCCADHSYLVKQNTKLLRALEELQHCCASLKEENCLLRKSCFPETEEKVKHLKRKNAELALIAKRLEERAKKLQEANLKIVNAPVAVKGSSLELCKKACAHQLAKDLTEQASALLAKDKQIEALQQECWELQAKLTAGKEGPHCLNLIDFDHLLRESQKEVLRLQRQIALKNFKESLHSSKAGSKSSLSIAANCLGPSVPTLDTSINFSSLSKGVQLGEPTLAMEAHRKVEPGVLPLGHASEEYENFPPKSVVADPESSQQIQQLEFELRKKRKKCENLEHEVRKKHKRCKELEIQLQVVQGENARLAQENTQLNGKAEWARQVESENADLKLQAVVVTKERDSALQKSQGLQTKLENLEQVLKHMRDVAERRQQLEAEHEEAQLALQVKQEEVRWLQQAQAEAKREHEGAVQLLENTLDCMQAQVRDLEDQCHSHIEQFSLLSQELNRFQLQTGKSGPLTSTLVTSELPLMPCCSIPQSQCHQWEKDPDVAPAHLALQCTKKIHDEGSEELESLPQIPDSMSSVTKIPVSGPAATSQKQVKRLESQSSSSKSESMQNSPKSCPTSELDTASEMEELDVDSIFLIPASESQGPAKLQVFLTRYSYNPFDGPNENPESELPLTAGEYIYIYGDMDEDGFFEGTPDAPLDVQAEPGPSAGILVISWLPVTIDAEGSSNGVRVTGYAVYADGQKVMEVASPTAGSVLVELSQLQMFQVCQEVSVRTMSLYGESADSVPAQIPSALLKASRHSSLPQTIVSTSLTSRLICGEPKGSPPKRMPVTHCTAPLFPPQKCSTDLSDAKFTVHTTPSCDSSVNCLPGKISPHLCLSSLRVSSVQVLGTSSPVSDTARHEQCLTSLPQPAGVGEEPKPSRAAALKGPGEDIQAQGTEELSVSKEPGLESSDVKMLMETCHACFVEERLKESTIYRDRKANEQCLSPEPQLSTHQDEVGVDSCRDSDRNGSSVQEFLRVTPGKKLMKEISRGDSSLMAPKVKREQEEKIAEAGKRQLNLLAEHSRSSDLSDILEEEEEDLCSDLQGEKQWDPRAYCSGENGGKLDSCDTDSDEEILERLLELPHQQNCSKKLFSIPEVTEEEEEEEKCVHVEKRESPDCFLERRSYHTKRKGTPLPISAPQAFPNTDGNDTYQNLPVQAPQDALILQKTREDSDSENPVYLELSWTQKRGSCNWGYQESRIKPTAGTSHQWDRKKGGNSQERAHDLPEVSRKKRSDIKEHCSRLLNTCSLTGGSLYRAHSLKEKLKDVSSASGNGGSEICDHARSGTFRKSHRKLMPSDLAEPAALTTHSFNTRSLEINIEYDSEEDQDLTFPSSPRSREWSDGSVEGSQTGCEGWSDCSSQSESAQSDGRTLLKKQEFGEKKGMEWAGSPSHHPQLPCPEKEALKSEGSSEEQGWEREGSPAGWRRMPERPWKGIPSSALHARASGNEDLRLQELLGSPACQIPTQKGNKTLRRSRILKSSISSSGTASEAVVKDNSIRIFVALFDYDPISMSPNPDAAEEELPFKEGQILKVCGDKDADGFYRGECAGRAGYIPCNMVSEVQAESEEVRKEMLKQGYIPAATSVKSIGNGTFARHPRRLTVPPPKPRRAKKAELEKQENYKPHPGSSWQDLRTDLITPRTMVAAFDYNPRESSPNVDVEAELTFTAGDVITVFGSMDDDGFYYGELNRQRGLVPSNFLEAVSLDRGMTERLHLEDKDTCAMSAKSQLNSDGPGEQRDPLPNIPEVPPSCTLICDPSPDQESLETLESSDLSTQSKKKRRFFCKGKKLFKKLGPSKKN